MPKLTVTYEDKIYTKASGSPNSITVSIFGSQPEGPEYSATLYAVENGSSSVSWEFPEKTSCKFTIHQDPKEKDKTAIDVEVKDVEVNEKDLKKISKKTDSGYTINIETKPRVSGGKIATIPPDNEVKVTRP
jgi:hypothetical protein